MITVHILFSAFLSYYLIFGRRIVRDPFEMIEEISELGFLFFTRIGGIIILFFLFCSVLAIYKQDHKVSTQIRNRISKARLFLKYELNGVRDPFKKIIVLANIISLASLALGIMSFKFLNDWIAPSVAQNQNLLMEQIVNLFLSLGCLVASVLLALHVRKILRR